MGMRKRLHTADIALIRRYHQDAGYLVTELAEYTEKAALEVVFRQVV